MLHVSHVVMKPVCVIVLRDNSFTSDLPAHMRSQIGVCLLFAYVKSIFGAIIIAYVGQSLMTRLAHAHCSQWLPRTIE